MTGLPAALSALAFASTASVADSLMAPMRREIRPAVDGVTGSEETAVMSPSCQRRSSATQSDVSDLDGRGELHTGPAAEVAEQRRRRSIRAVARPLRPAGP